MTDKEANEFAGGLAVTAILAIAVVFGIAMFANSGSDAPEGVTGADLRLAVQICTPISPTFEEKLACTQAVYGGLNVDAPKQ